MTPLSNGFEDARVVLHEVETHALSRSPSRHAATVRFYVGLLVTFSRKGFCRQLGDKPGLTFQCSRWCS